MKKNNNEKADCDLGYPVSEGVLCLNCTLETRGERFILATQPIQVDLNATCFRCGLKYKDANTDDAFNSVFIIYHL